MRIGRPVILILLSVLAAYAWADRSLTFEERIKAQEAIEQVYYRHLVWPKENPASKPSFDRMVPQEIIRHKVEDYIAKSELLEEYWQRPLTSNHLQAEMNRMARESKDPATLEELFSALQNDPFLIAECLARPVLAERTLSTWYAFDQYIHSDVRERAVRASNSALPFGSNEGSSSAIQGLCFEIGTEDQEHSSCKQVSQESFDQLLQNFPQAPGLSSVEEAKEAYYVKRTDFVSPSRLKARVQIFYKIPIEEWIRQKSGSLPLLSPITAREITYSLPALRSEVGEYAPDSWTVEEYFPAPRRGSFTTVWTGQEMIVWGGETGYYSQTNSGGRYNPAVNSWTPTTTTNAPAARQYHSAVWTGSEMIVWGGYGASGFNAKTGGRYNPVTDSWIATPYDLLYPIPWPRDSHTAIWTGDEMIVWGGYDGSGGGYRNDGWAYNPNTNEWHEIGSSGAPTARSFHTAIWTGKEMIVWGGQNLGTSCKTGGKFNPTTNTWTATSIADPDTPSQRYSHTAAWSGSVMIVWGGTDISRVNTGGCYDPDTDGWTPTSSTNAPVARYQHSAVWTGNAMIIWGGLGNANRLNSGAIYNPVSDAWTTTSTTNAPAARSEHAAVWTGDEMIIWGGQSDSGYALDGGRYTPSLNGSQPWVTMPKPGTSPRWGHSAVWTGVEMVVWGGALGLWLPTGGRYNPALDNWQDTSTVNAPEARADHTTVWTGDTMIIWGGMGSTLPVEGGRYNPTANTWNAVAMPTANAPAGRRYHSAVWSGSEMIVWGGVDNNSPRNFFNTGGKYNPSTNTWDPSGTSTTGAPSQRAYHTAVWTGAEMIVWGGMSPAFAPLGDGAKYLPSGNTWAAVPMDNAPVARYMHTAVWTGTDMIIWGGWGNGNGYNLLVRYRSGEDAWIPSASAIWYSQATAVWTGEEMIIWGGFSSITYARRYSPRWDYAGSPVPAVKDSTTLNAPPGRTQHTAVWTGNAMIIFGGNPDYRMGIYYTDTQPTALPDITNASDTITIGDGLPLSLSHALPTSWMDEVEYGSLDDALWKCGDPNPDPTDPHLKCVEGQWHTVFSQNCSGEMDYYSPYHAWRFGKSALCDYSGGAGTYTLTTSVPHTIEEDTLLVFRYYLDCDLWRPPTYTGDKAVVEISSNGGSTWTAVAIDEAHRSSYPNAVPISDRGEGWQAVSIRLKNYASLGASILLRFSFVRDANGNNTPGWILDDIGIGSPAGDGCNPAAGPIDSRGSDPNGGIPDHDTFDKARFEWFLDNDQMADNPDATTPLFTILEEDPIEPDLETYGLITPGDHSILLRVTDLNGSVSEQAITLHVLDGMDPTVSLITPDGGESWAYSGDDLHRQYHRLLWNATDNYALRRIKLSYSTDAGASWTCIADTDDGNGGMDCAPNGLSVGVQNYLWIMPTQYEAQEASPSQLFPSASCRIKILVEDESGNFAEDASDANFYIVQPTTTSIKTLVAWDSVRVCQRFDQIPPDPACTCASATTDPDCNITYSLSNKLIELKDHEKVSGVVLDLAAVPAVQTAYTTWDGYPLNITKANDASAAVRTYLLDQANNTYTNTQYLILVGDDHQIPFHRMTDGATIYPESEYPAEVGLNTTTPVGYALDQGYFLTDNYYSELTPEASGLPSPHEWVYQNDFAIGRLIETPAQIEGIINTFLAQNGQVNALPDGAPSPNKKNRILISGLDFLHDGATKIAQTYDQRGYTPAEDLDTLIDDPAPGQTGDEYTPAQLESQLFPTTLGENMHYISNINTHANHYSYAASLGAQKLYCTDPAYNAAACYASGMDANPKDLKSSVLYTSGCHSGLTVDNTGPDTKALDLPEVMAKKGVVGYIGNTGYGWGLRNGRGLTETLMEKLTDAIVDNKNIAIGKALAQAKRNYFLNEKRWDVFDEKVMHELTLFGIPNYLVVTGETGLRLKAEGGEPGTRDLRPETRDNGQRTTDQGQAAEAALPLPDGPDHGCADGICLEKKLTGAGEGSKVPGGVMALDLNFTMCSGDCTPCPPPGCTYDLHQTADGYYYTLNTRASGEVGDTLQPQFIFNAYLSDINAHGVIFTGGHYLTDPGAFDPVIAVPRSTNDDSDEGPLPSSSGWTPSLRVSFGCAAGLGLRGEIGEVGYTNMLVYTGMCEDYQVDTCTQSRFKDMAFVIYYSNYADVTAPGFVTKGHTVSGMTATFTAEVTDASGVYRVLVTYRDKQESRWNTLELTNTTGDQWTGTLELTGDTLYYWQAVDNAGNVGVPSASGPDKAGPPYPLETPYGSTWSGPETGEIVLPDGDTDGLPDAYEDLHACLNKTVDDSGGDPDFDELTSLDEFRMGTDPCVADTDGDGDNDGSELHNAKDPFIAGDGDRLTLWPVKQAPGDLLLMWYRGTDDGTPGGAACDPGVSLPPCTAIGDNDAIDGHFRVYISMDPRFSTNDHRIGPDGDLDDGATDLDQDDQREYLLVNADLPAEYQSAPLLYFQVLNWDVLVNAPLVETVVRNGSNFTIYGQYFHPTQAEALLCEAADACDSPVTMTVTSRSDERIQATAPGGVTGTKYVAVRNPDGLVDIYSTPYPF